MRYRNKQRHPCQALVLAGVAALLLAGCATGQPAQRPESAATGSIVASPTVDGARSSSAAPVELMPESTPVRLQVPSIGVDTGLMDLGLQPDGTMDVPPDGALAGWYTKAPTPGEIGPAIIAAHVDWNGQPGVFYNLDQLKPGDEASVQRQDGTTAIFQITRVEQYPKDNFPTDTVYGNLDHAGLRLITCGGDFDQRARSYEDNIIAYARLADASSR